MNVLCLDPFGFLWSLLDLPDTPLGLGPVNWNHVPGRVTGMLTRDSLVLSGTAMDFADS